MAAFMRLIGLFLVLALIIAGCDSSSAPGGGASMNELASAASAQKAAEDEKAQEKAEADLKAEEAAKAAAGPPAPRIEVVTSHSPKKGRTLEGGGYLSIVAGTRFWAEHQIILNNILHATRLWEAEHGRYPKTQEEFMREIIEPNEPATALPELPEGWEYYYDPATPLELKMIDRGGGEPGAVQ
ncbi:MAG: hypothetical protein WD738_01850 [Pirellulales bacterium]